MRHLIVLVVALSLGTLGENPGAAALSTATPTDCSHASEDVSPHGATHHAREKASTACCGGLCLGFVAVQPFRLVSTRIAHATGQASDSYGNPRDIEPADPPPRG